MKRRTLQVEDTLPCHPVHANMFSADHNARQSWVELQVNTERKLITGSKKLSEAEKGKKD